VVRKLRINLLITARVSSLTPQSFKDFITVDASGLSIHPSFSPDPMKSFGILCVFMSSAFSSPTFLSPDAQLSIGEVDAGFEAAWLSERRLIEIPGNPPKWVTELEKVRKPLCTVCIANAV